jgi:DNA-directed RNA polymerase specialized sigma24 family protein
LTQQVLDRFLESLDRDRYAAGVQYEKIRAKLIRFFEWRNCPAPEEHADETIGRMMKKIDAGEEIADFHTYCYGIARMVLLEVFKQQNKEHDAIEYLRTFSPNSEKDEVQEQRRACLDRCLERLTLEQRELILQYYQGGEGDQIHGRKILAAQLSIPPNALRIRAFRIREGLESCVKLCLETPRMKK